MKKLKPLIVSIGLPLLLGAISAFISNMDTYSEINKPFLSPPGIVFPIVWTILYILMGVSYGILKDKGLVDEEVSKIYYLQLIVNALWPIAFFVLKWRFFALLWIILLGYLVLKMIVEFYKKDKLAGVLQIPYFIWIVFATYLNFFVYLLNR